MNRYHMTSSIFSTVSYITDRISYMYELVLRSGGHAKATKGGLKQICSWLTPLFFKEYNL